MKKIISVLALMVLSTISVRGAVQPAEDPKQPGLTPAEKPKQPGLLRAEATPAPPSAPCAECKPPCVCKCPTPPQTGMLLCVEGTSLVWCDHHLPPFQYRECATCCNYGRDTGWPCMNAKTLGEMATLGSCTMIEFRMGPFNRCNEPDWRGIGGPYVEDAECKADLDKWNEPFFDEVDRQIQAARSHGMIVNIGLDGWAIDQRQYATYDEKPYYMPWAAEGNIQGEEHALNLCGPLDDRHRAYVRKLVERFGKYDNVVWFDLNEPYDLGESYCGSWSVSDHQVIREAEAEFGYAKHLWFGAGQKDDLLDPVVQAGILQGMIIHTEANQPGPENNVPTMLTERNPQPPWDEMSEWGRYCYSKARNVYYGAWMGAQSMQQFQATLGMISGWQCTQKAETGCPQDVLPLGWISCHKQVQQTEGWRWDCTPKNTLGQNILPEGNGSRIYCELSVCAANPWGNPDEGAPEYITTGNCHLNLKPNPWQFVVVFDGPGNCHINCKVKGYPTEDQCNVTAVQ